MRLLARVGQAAEMHLHWFRPAFDLTDDIAFIYTKNTTAFDFPMEFRQ
jgi:hypothetical protein